MSKISEKKDAVQSCMNLWRESAYKSVCDAMADCFDNLGMILSEIEGEEGEQIYFDRTVAGMPAELMKTIQSKYLEGVTESWLESMDKSEKEACMAKFLNFDHLRMEDFRRRYPNSFRKWTEEEDERLLKAYSFRDGDKVWKKLSDQFGRNANALKIRLERLGVNLGENAGHKRY